MVKPVPETEMAEILRFEFPVFVRVINCDVEVPTCTSPKPRFELLVESTAVAGPGVVLSPDDGADAFPVDVFPVGALPADWRVAAHPIVPSVTISATARRSALVQDCRPRILLTCSR